MKTIKQVLGVFIIMMAGFGIISNVLHFIGIRKTEAIDLSSSSEYKQIKDIMSDIKSKKDKMGNLNLVSSDEMNNIKNYINACYEGLNNLNIFKYEDITELNDIYKFDLVDQVSATRCPAFTIHVLETISKYDENVNSIKQVYASGLYESMTSIELISQRLLHNFEYNTTFISSHNRLSRPKMYETKLILNSIRTQALVLQYLVDYNIENAEV